jgi:hypothetical protein
MGVSGVSKRTPQNVKCGGQGSTHNIEEGEKGGILTLGFER